MLKGNNLTLLTNLLMAIGNVNAQIKLKTKKNNRIKDVFGCVS